jgi:hypothetical protein
MEVRRGAAGRAGTERALLAAASTRRARRGRGRLRPPPTQPGADPPPAPPRTWSCAMLLQKSTMSGTSGFICASDMFTGRPWGRMGGREARAGRGCVSCWGMERQGGVTCRAAALLLLFCYAQLLGTAHLHHTNPPAFPPTHTPHP